MRVAILVATLTAIAWRLLVYYEAERNYCDPPQPQWWSGHRWRDR